MKTNKSLFALLSALLLSIAISSPVFAGDVKSGLGGIDGPYTIFNMDPERTS